ncbi:MAG: tRNA glutamyl-Q(34) synthetase GluQRS [Candidatus Adiutrix sp.]|nr:tRNA glutamyl-Q(34) synthetase GluQRS [Candidatus Adiutrix sp.]
MRKKLNDPALRGRLAPSPTGLLHLGNAWAFWLAWLQARRAGGRLVLRLEDLDPARSRSDHADRIRRDLKWLGLDWDEEAPAQSRRGPAYEAALAGLSDRGLIYPCFCTRRELRSLAGAPQVGDAGAAYAGTCRALSPERRAAQAASGRARALRLICPPERAWSFQDLASGPQSLTLAECGGDFALRRSDGVFAYQLAVVVDDLDQGVTSVVRGRDLLASTPRQLYLFELLGGRAPAYAHVPLILDHQGERLAKRHAGLSLTALREAGVRPESIFGFLARLAGFSDRPGPLAAGALAPGFDWAWRRPEDLRLPENVDF